MKTKLMTLLCLLALAAGSVNSVRADDFDSSGAAATDALIARPLGLVATAFGSLLFVFSLPFTAPSGHVRQSAQVLVVKPAQATFNRPLGDFSTLD